MHKPTELWDVDDVASYLRVPKSSIYKMTSQRTRNPIPHVKLGNLLRFRKHDIDTWLDVWTVSSVERLGTAKSRAQTR